MARVFLVHKTTGARYEILHIDKKSSKMTLQGPRAKFEEDYDVPKLKARGYRLEKEPDNAEQQGV